MLFEVLNYFIFYIHTYMIYKKSFTIMYITVQHIHK